MKPATGAILIASILAGPAIAGELSVSTKSRAGLMQYQLDLLDQRAERAYSPPIGIEPPRVVIPGTPEAESALAAISSPYLSSARSAARTHRIPESLFLRLIARESGWNPQAVSPKGAIGLAQLMPHTARLLRVDPRDPAQNLEGGARYLRMMHDRFGDWRLALAAYNAGPEAVERYRGMPPFAETRKHVQAILGRR